MRHKSRLVKIIFAVVLIIFNAQFLLPLVWMLLTSLKAQGEIYSNPLGLPEQWLLSNYVSAFKHFDFLQLFVNSVIYTGATVFLVLLSVTLFTYATARFDFKSAKHLQGFVQIGMAIPGGATLMGIYQILVALGLKNTYSGMILTYCAISIPLAAVVLYGHFRSLPFAMEEAAAIDGAGTFGTFFKIILPMAMPGLSTIAITTMMNIWNEYTIASIMIDKNALKPLTVGVSTFVSARGTDWGGMAATLVLCSIPVIILYLFFNESLENILTTSSAVK